MKKFYAPMVLGLALCFACVSFSWASTYNFTPPDADMYDLDHGHYYTWGLDWDIPDGEKIVGATLAFDNIRNWNSGDNVLFTHLLDTATTGITIQNDNNYTDDFTGQGLKLFQWDNLPDTPQDLAYTFTTSDLSTLVSYLSDGNFGFGFDPDCHFYNDGIKFTVDTAPVPIPGAVWLLGSGLLGLIGVRRKRG